MSGRKDLALFMEMSREPVPATPQEVQIHVLVPAFMISELRRAFEIGFLLFVPFLIIDLVVASILMSVGMMMLPPVTVALPFKLIFFVLVDGWGLRRGIAGEELRRLAREPGPAPVPSVSSVRPRPGGEPSVPRPSRQGWARALPAEPRRREAWRAYPASSGASRRSRPGSARDRPA